jgi:hypothetical protein
MVRMKSAMPFSSFPAALLVAAGWAAAQHDFENTAGLTKYPLFAFVDLAHHRHPPPKKGGGLTLSEIGTATKSAKNPLWVQDRAWEPRIDNGYPNVVHDPSDPLGAWRMWYGADLWEYATSDDGIAWVKPDLGMFDLGTFNPRWAEHGKHNNVIMYGQGMGIYKDLHEKDPSRRFKAFGGPSCYGGNYPCADLCQGVAVSPDGLHWRDARNLTWPYTAGCNDPSCPHQKYDTHQNLFWDASKNKYLATTRDLRPFPWRSVAIAESYPGEFAWNTTDAPPSVEQGTANEQPYAQITFPYYGIYLGLVAVNDAEYEQTKGEVHLRLSWSPDAETWHWVDKGGLTGKDFIPLGTPTPGDPNPFDSHIIFGTAYPIKMKDDASVRLYYMGGNGPHSGPRNSSFALANLRPDGFVAVSGSGIVRTVPIRCTAQTLVVTTDVEDGGSVRVGVAGVVGLGPSDATAVTGNVTDRAVAFPAAAPGALGKLVGKDVVLELVIDRAKVFIVGFQRD